MAKRRTMTALQRQYFAPRAPAAIVVRTRSAPVKRHARRGRRRSNGGGLVGSHNVQMAIGGALFGFAVKSGVVAKLPAIPVVGRTGTAAILLDYWGKHGGGDMVRKAATAAAVLAGYQLGSEGKITGDVDGFDTMGDDTAGDMEGLDTMGGDDV